MVFNGKGDKLYVPGLRASTNPVKGLNVQGEVAWQLGNQVVTECSIGDQNLSIVVLWPLN